MPALPSSVRLALWVTSAWAGSLDLDEAVSRSFPDIDHVAGDLDRLELWQGLGEQALLVGLPAPGDLTGIPAAGEGAAAAAAVGECVFVPGIGGMLVPNLSEFGSEVSGAAVDSGTRIDWTAHDADPVPRHRVEALDASNLERHLREQLLEATGELDAMGGQPFGADAARGIADAALSDRWGLPPGIPGRAQRVMVLSAAVGAITDVALDWRDDALEVTTSGRRRVVLRRLQRTADQALADATNSAVSVLAGWRPA